MTAGFFTEDNEGNEDLKKRTNKKAAAASPGQATDVSLKKALTPPLSGGISERAGDDFGNGAHGVARPTSALDALDQKLSRKSVANIPEVHSFREYLETSARVPLRGGTYGKFSFVGRAPLEFIVGIIDKIIANTLHGEAVTIDGVEFGKGKLKGATVSVGGGAQWGKTVLVLNFTAFSTFIEFVNFGYYTPDQELLAKIVDTKFRPDVIDQQPWMASMISVGKAENASGKTVNRKNSYQVSDGDRKAFGHFCGMQKPPTTISLDAAALDEVDDIPQKNMGYVDGRMTGSPLQLKLEIGTQRVAGAGQNARVKAGTYHVRMYACPECDKEWNLEEEFPRIVRVRKNGPLSPALSPSEVERENSFAPSIKPEDGHDRDAHYYCACPECGTELDRDGGKYVAKNPHKIKDAHFSIRVSQLNISAISMQEIVGAWYAAMADPSGESLVAFYCDRIAIPNAGAAQPITQKVLDRCRESYAMSLAAGSAMRFAGMDTGPRCWFWCDEVSDHRNSRLIWAELISSGNAPSRAATLTQQLGVSCLFIDAGGEPDLTKRIVLALNGLEEFKPPMVPQSDLLKMQMGNLGVGISWDGERGRWTGIKAAAVLFVAGEAKGIVQTIGFTQDGKIYPLIKCNRGESIQTAVNDFLTPEEGVLEMVPDKITARNPKATTIRSTPRAHLPTTFIGAGASQAVLEGHLLNLRKERDTRTGEEDWIDGVENHLGLAKVYARLASTVGGSSKRSPFAFSKSPIAGLTSPPRNLFGMGRLKAGFPC